MKAKDLLPRLHAALGFKLKLIEDIQAYFDDSNRYPDSYREVMTIEEEMVGSMYSQYAFSDAEGNLVGLNLYGCDLEDRHISFFQDETLREGLKELLSLNLSKNKITKFTLPKQLSKLTFVYMNENPALERVKCEEGLKHLARLEFTETKISRFQIPNGYDSLYFVDLSSNESLTEFRLAGACPHLQILLVRGTSIRDFKLPDGFEELVHLYLNNNKLESLEIKSQLPKLSTLQLRDNSLKSIPENILECAPNLDSLFLGKNPLPEELSTRLENIADQNHLDIYKSHIAQRAIGTPKRDNECKVLLIGNGKAGKSAIVNRIVNDDFNPEWDSTHGISLLQKELEEYVLNFWDFGGQDIYHATHRLFMQQNAVYILAWSQETEKEFTDHEFCLEGTETYVKRRYKNHGLRYWLEYAKHLGHGSPMNVVQTKIGKDAVIDKSHLAPHYKDAFEPEMAFHAVESSENDAFDSGYDKLMASLQMEVATIKGSGTIAEPLYDIRDFLRKKQEAGQELMSYEEYEQKAIELQVQQPREMLETWLFKSGVVYFRPGKFNDKIILDQGWAIKAIYTIFNRAKNIPFEIEKRKGVFDGALLKRVWEKDYPDQDTHSLFVSFMKSCDLCFEIDTGKEHPSFEERVFMAPQLLEKERPSTIDDFWEFQKNSIHYKYSHDFIHEGVIHSFITKTAYLASLRDIWRIGIQICEVDQYAWVEAGNHEISIQLTSNGKPLLQKIRALLQELQGPNGKEEISQDGQSYEPYRSDMMYGSKRGLRPELSLAEMDELMIQEQMAAVQKSSLETQFHKDQPMPTTDLDREYLKKLVKEEVKTEMEEFQTKALKNILFISANPKGTEHLQIGFELRKLTNELKGGSCKDQFEFLFPELALDKSNFLKILDHKPFILHFSGHGNTEGICIQDGNNKPEPVPNEVLELIFEDLKELTHLVVLNSCLSVYQAQIISQFIPFVIGTTVRIRDEIAIAFSEGLYNGLGQGNDIQDSIRRGIISATFKEKNAKYIFQTWHKGKQLNW